ncbi:MAG: zinc metalloprotease HtpX [Anaerolineales bacterium]
MLNLFLRSMIVLALLFGLLFAVGMGVVFYFDLTIEFALLLALGVLVLQFLLGPTIIQFIYKIEWVEPETVDPEMAVFLVRACQEQNIPIPRFGLIRDGNPNAFTFGHYPGDARLVVTSGLMDLLDPEERNAVVAHELGHIKHWDFVVMTVAAAVPLLLYVIYITTSRGRRRGKSGGYALLIALISFVAYLISQYIVLLLSRVREYYADQFAGEVTRNPESLGSALVKIAYGLAAAPKEEAKKDDARMVAARAFGIFDPMVAQSLALAGAGSGAVSSASMQSAMKWDLWNPWASLYELRSSHPLPAKRIRALERQTKSLGRSPRFSFRAERPESFWDEFLVDVFVSFLPLWGLLAGVLFSLLLAAATPFFIGAIGLVLLSVSGAWWIKRQFSYRHEFSSRRDVKSLVSEVKVSAVRSIPCTIKGKIIGRGVPGLFFSEDLVLQDHTGFVVVDYRQPLRFLEFLFGWIKAESFIGRNCEAVGWYRRSPRPYFELRKLEFDDGEKVTSYSYPFAQFFLYLMMGLGFLLVLVDVLPIF